jgi:hypothetical protein
MLPIEVLAALQRLMRSISIGDFHAALAQCAKSRLTEDDLRKVIQEYGRTLITPPSKGDYALDAVPLNNVNVSTWSVRAPLWTQEEGRSDLSLETTITLGSNGVLLELDDLRVL